MPKEHGLGLYLAINLQIARNPGRIVASSKSEISIEMGSWPQGDSILKTTEHVLSTNSDPRTASVAPPLSQHGQHMDVIKVSAGSRSTAVAGAVAGVVREHGRAEVQAIGASAVNQAVKAIAIARGYLELDGIDIFCVPSFTEVQIDNQERTAVRLSVEQR
jgi:stage V sporulation protein S